MKKNNTSLVFYASLFTMIVSVGIFIFFFKVIQNKNEHASKVRMTLSDKIAQKANTDLIEEKISEVQSKSKIVNSYFLDTNNIDKFVEYLEKLGSDNQTDLLVKDIQVPQAEKNRISVKILINGKFADIMQTIALLENSPYQINITQSFLNKIINEQVVPVTGKTKNIPIEPPSLWQADIIFNILTS